jgi:hypothetical protein
MSYSLVDRASVLCLSTCVLAACGVSPSSDAKTDGLRSGTVTSSVAATPIGAVAALLALADPTSPGGASITPEEAAAYIAQVPGFGGDDSVDALGVLARFEDTVSAPQISPLAVALRHHVQGLRISGMTVTGLTISSCSGGDVTAVFDPEGANYSGVTLVYSDDAWSNVHDTALVLGSNGHWSAGLPGLDPQRDLVFAVQLAQPTGDTLWLNDPRENVPGASGHVDYRQALSLCEPVATPTTEPFARLVQSFASLDSLGGATVTGDEFSWLVAQTTWEGGPGTDDPGVIDPTVAALDAMSAAGVAFEGGTYANMRAFLGQMRMRTTTTSAVSVQRNSENQYVQVTAPLGTQWMRVYYSTDGWSTPKVVECTPLGRAGYVSCGLGYMPVDALVSFSAIERDASSADQYVHASDGGNIFQKVP